MATAGEDAAEWIAGLEALVQPVAAVGIDQHRHLRVLVGVAIQPRNDGAARALDGDVLFTDARFAATSHQRHVLGAGFAGLLFGQAFHRGVVSGGVDQELEPGLEGPAANVDRPSAGRRPQHRARQG